MGVKSETRKIKNNSIPKFCPNCGQQNNGNNLYCTECGVKIE